MRNLQIINISFNNKYNIIVSDYEFERLKFNFIRLIKDRMKAYNNKLYCDLTKSYLNTNVILGFFEYSRNVNKKSFIISFKNTTFKGIPVKTLIKSIDYGTLNIAPKRVFYPLFNDYRNNYLMYIH